VGILVAACGKPDASYAPTGGTGGSASTTATSSTGTTSSGASSSSGTGGTTASSGGAGGGALRAMGAPCTDGKECQSGACSTGVCCNMPCNGTCEACTNAVKGQGIDGVCGYVIA